MYLFISFLSFLSSLSPLSAMGLINHVDLTVIDVNSCKGAFEVLPKVFFIVPLVVINMPNL